MIWISWEFFEAIPPFQKYETPWLNGYKKMMGGNG